MCIRDRYRILNLVLNMKCKLVNLEVLDAVFGIVTAAGTQPLEPDMGPSSPRSLTPNHSPRSPRVAAGLLVNALALSYIALDFTLWSRCSRAAALELFNRIKLFASDKQACHYNLHVLRRARLIPRLIDFIRSLCVFHQNDVHQQDLLKVIGAAVRILSLMLSNSVEPDELLIVSGFLLYTIDPLRATGIVRANKCPDHIRRHHRSNSITRFPFFNSPPIKTGSSHGGSTRSGELRKLNLTTLTIDIERSLEARHQILLTLISIPQKHSKTKIVSTITSVMTAEFLLEILEAEVCTQTAELIVRLMSLFMVTSTAWLDKFRAQKRFLDLQHALVPHHFGSSDVHGVLLQLLVGVSWTGDRFTPDLQVTPERREVFCPEVLPIILEMIHRCASRSPGIKQEQIQTEPRSQSEPPKNPCSTTPETPASAIPPAVQARMVRPRAFSFHSPSEPLSLIHISEPTRLLSISYAVFCLKKKKNNRLTTNRES
eukprot:TRINITY_DN26688_c0_g1_i1.p1 TRINITY_DN26688_c0_g1~~TRINITY_DN26688_c0_g1_i1.p1  ORF type:complete len:486 (-),score=96.05 TRINITY_DN26688_c0_g1_i1:23-1480(-)